MVPISVNKCRVLAVVDTGSQATLASPQLCKMAGVTPSEHHKIKLRGIGDDMGIVASIAFQVPLFIGNGEYLWTVIVGDIREDFILGLDFLHEVGARLDFNHGFLQVFDSIIFAEFISSVDGRKVPLASVVVNEKTKIPALHCSDVICDVAERFSPDADLIIEPIPGNLPISFEPFVIKGAPHVPVLVANLSEHICSLPVGTIIGMARPVDEIRQLGSDSEDSLHVDGDNCHDVSLKRQVLSSSLGVPDLDPDLDPVPPGVAGGTIPCFPTVTLPVSASALQTETSSFPDLDFRFPGGVDVDNSCDVEGSRPPGGDPAVSSPDGLFPHEPLPEHLLQLYLRSLKNLEGEEGTSLRHLLIQYQDVFARHDFDLGEFRTIMHRIDTGDAAPVKHGLRRTPLGFQPQEEAHLQMMLDHGIIQPSSSAWAAAPVIVKKKDGNYRYCVDYRGLNELTRRDSFPLPLIEECLDALSDTAFFSTLDMASGYWQIVIDPRDRHKTAFITKYGLFEHVRLAMGLCNSPATYQRIMTYVLQNMLWKDALVYLDDIIVLGKSYFQHLQALEEIFQRFRSHNLKLKPKKCELLVTEVDFLGRRVGREGIGIQEAKIQSVLEWKVPETRTELESFLGFINYHREFIPHLSGTADVLYQLVKVTPAMERLKWTPIHQEAFDQLKRAMVVAPVLAYPNSTGTFILDVDASDIAVGAELLQLQDDVEQVIAYGSQSLSQAQRRYCTTRKELLSLVTFLNHFRFYLLGRYFLVRTDHNSLIWLMSFKNVEGQLARWLEAISQFDFRIVHRPGRAHGNADGLSRIPTDRCPHYQADIQVDQLPCGGCKYCTRMHQQWTRFEGFVDDVMPLVMRSATVVSEDGPEENPSLEIDWKTEQRNDPDIAIVIRWLTVPEIPTDNVLFLQSSSVKHLWRMRDQLVMQDQVLRYKWIDASCVEDRLLYVVPRQLRFKVMTLAHDNICAGHPGPEKMLHLVRRKYYWYGMVTDIKVFAQSCDNCTRGKKGNRTPRSPMKKYHSGEPMERVHLDILGPLTTSAQGNRYILVIIDQFTKWVELAALPEQSSQTVAKVFIEQFVCRLGCALHIFTDQGRNFEGHLFYQICELLQMAKSRTTPYRPSSNGQVERMNREILAKLRIYIGGQQQTWDKYLPFIGMAMRATVNKSTGFSPNMMMLGREVTLPLDLLSSSASAVPTDGPDPAEYVSHLRDTLEEVHTRARARIGAALESRKQLYDKQLSQGIYDVGDVVYLKNSAGKKGYSRKLQEIFKGPYLLIQKRSPWLYVVTNQRGQHQVVHHDRLRHCSDNNIPLWARRERRKLLEEPPAVEILEDSPPGLGDLFGEDLEEDPEIEENRPSVCVDIPDDPPSEEASDTTVAVPTVSKPCRSSGRKRRQPTWLRDFILDRGVTSPH